VIAATAEPEDKVREGTANLSFPVGFGVTKSQAESLGSWWEDRRQIIQPSNFVLNAEGKVLSATYSTGPIGRLEAVDAVRFIQFQEKQKQSS
jgi:hypothetical protein